MNSSEGIPGGIHGIVNLDNDEDYTDFMKSIAREVVQRRLTVPVIIFLETVKPLSFLGNQLLIFANPVISLVVSAENYYRFVRMLENRENVEKLIVAIEEENDLEVRRRMEEKEERRRNGVEPFWKRFVRKGGR